jgi:hypothetical protein
VIYALWFLALFAAVCVLLGGVAVVATLVNRPRTARFYADRSARADRIATAIAEGEAAALACPDRLALAAGCATALRALFPGYGAEQDRLDLWDRYSAKIGAVPQCPDGEGALWLAACLWYCLDLADEELHGASRGYDAIHRANIPMGAFHLSGLLRLVDGWDVLEGHRDAGIYALANPGATDAPRCPFCTWGEYDQTWMRCSRCAIEGETVRTVPAVPLPKRTAPDPLVASRRAYEIEAQALNGMRTDARSSR